jgi:hypothetical protein
LPDKGRCPPHAGPIVVALRSYPRQFRARFGADLARALADDWREAGRGPLISRLRDRGRLLSATITSGCAERGAALARQTWRTHRSHLYAPSGRRAAMFDSLMHDVRAAVRGLTAARAFTTLTIVALGLGLGANSAVFAVVNGVLLRPLPYEHPERLAMLWSENPRMANETNPLSPANFDDLKRMNRSFESLDYALSFIVRVAIQGQEDQGVVQVLRVGSTLLPIVGARVQLGRLMEPDERNVAIVSDRAWRTRPGADPAGRVAPSCLRATSHSPSSASPRRSSCFLRDMLWQAGTTTPHLADLWVPMPIEGPRWCSQTAPWSGRRTPSWRSAVCVRASRRRRPAPSCARTPHTGRPLSRHHRGWSARRRPAHAGHRLHAGRAVGACRPARCSCCSWPR